LELSIFEGFFLVRNPARPIELIECSKRVVHIGEEGSIYGPLSSHFAANALETTYK
jgi:hypothetical protein